MTEPLPALLAEVTRGPAVESRHFGHVVAVDADGEVLFTAGNPEHPTYPRSSLKPLQAVAALSQGTAERFEYTDAEVAVTCASHAAEPRHREAVARILEKIGAREADLRCGPHSIAHIPTRDALIREGREPTPIFSNCSGKHAGMLALARILGAPLAGYWEPDHPVQREIQRLLHDACGTDREHLQWGTDGCGVPTYRMPLRELALGFARLAAPDRLPGDDQDAARRITRSMMAEPGMVRGEGGLDTVLMEALPGAVFSKGGAEGCQALGIPGHGIGVAVKIEDGAARALPPLAVALLTRFDALPTNLSPALRSLSRPEILNTRGEPVGEIRAAL